MIHIFNIIIPLIAFGLSLVLAGLVLQQGIRKSVNWSFFLFLLGMSLWGFFTYTFRNSDDADQALNWDKALMFIVVFTSVMFLHFSIIRTSAVKTKIPLFIAYAILILIIFLLPTRFIIEDIDYDKYGPIPVIGPMMFLIALASYTFFIGGLIYFIRSYRKSVSYEERNSYLFIIAGVLVFLVFGLGDLASSLGVPIPPIALIGNSIFVILATIALLKFRLIDMHMVIRRGIAYLLTIAIIGLIYVGIIALILDLIGRPLEVWAYLVLLIVVTIALPQIWIRIQHLVDRWFFGERIDFLKELALFSQKTHRLGDIDELTYSLASLIRKALQASTVHLLLRANSGDYEVKAEEGENISIFNLEYSSPVIHWLKQNKKILRRYEMDIDPQLQSISLRISNEFNKIKAELFVPLLTETELVGILIIGEKQSREPYSTQDERVLLTVSSRISVELENDRLYESEIATRYELEGQNKLRTEFLHSVAHELKTPLTAIMSSSELLEEEAYNMPDSMKKRTASNIKKSALAMNRRVDELLDFAKMQIGELIIKPKPMILDKTINDAAEQLQIIFKSKKQNINLEVQKPVSHINADKDRVEQILFNLLSNASKFSPPGAQITLRKREKDDNVLVEIEDTAPIIPIKDREKIFEPYYRTQDTDRRERVPGLGLGLAITKKLVEAHHGLVWVGSKENQGNIFTFSIPKLNKT